MDQWIKLQAIKFAQRQREDANALRKSLQLLAEVKDGRVSSRIVGNDMEDEADSSMHETKFIQTVLNASKKGVPPFQTAASENNQMLFEKKSAKKVQIKDTPIESSSANLHPLNKENQKVLQGIMKRKTTQDANIARDEKKETKTFSSPPLEGASSFKRPTKADYRALIASSQIGGAPNKTSWWKKIFKLKTIGNKDTNKSTGYQEVIALFISILNPQ